MDQTSFALYSFSIFILAEGAPQNAGLKHRSKDDFLLCFPMLLCSYPARAGQVVFNRNLSSRM